ncbi:MAG: hypothetical protein IPH00_11705 [Flavobacteriales bacterium]|nr:hypothetical protein [Flavobacteriales bacterium]
MSYSAGWAFNASPATATHHTKNTSFLMDRAGRLVLAPAYDMTFAYDPKNLWLH